MIMDCLFEVQRIVHCNEIAYRSPQVRYGLMSAIYDVTMDYLLKSSEIDDVTEQPVTAAHGERATGIFA